MLYVKKLKRKPRPEDLELPEYNKAVVHSASGSFKYLYNRHVLPVVCVWTFSLDKGLRLNITFNYIFLSSGSTDCSRGNVNIQNKARQRRNRPELLYCGQHARFNAYPDLVHLSLKFVAKEMIMYRLSAFFSVMDRFVVITKRMKFKMFGFIPYSTHIFRNKDMLFSYHLKTRKIDYILLKTGNAPALLFIHDGPGPNFKLLETDTFVETSTFQCFVQIFTAAERNFTNSSLNDTEEDIRFTSRKLKQSRIVNLLYDMSTEVIFVPDSLCYPSPCVIHIQTESGNQINVTVDHVKLPWRRKFRNASMRVW